jgi:Universal stress protein family
MAYKTIMVCLNEVDRIERLLDFAIEIADHQNAHILGLYVIPAVQIYPSVTIDVSPQIFESYRNFFKRHAQRVRNRLRAECAGPVSHLNGAWSMAKHRWWQTR